tara:strand:+ start:599 stop:877 length:279 start_codon:yes stop_codon:yes gene_type:complete
MNETVRTKLVIEEIEFDSSSSVFSLEYDGGHFSSGFSSTDKSSKIEAFEALMWELSKRVGFERSERSSMKPTSWHNDSFDWDENNPFETKEE